MDLDQVAPGIGVIMADVVADLPGTCGTSWRRSETPRVITPPVTATRMRAQRA